MPGREGKLADDIDELPLQMKKHTQLLSQAIEAMCVDMEVTQKRGQQVLQHQLEVERARTKEVERTQAGIAAGGDQHSVELQSLRRMCVEAAEACQALRSQVDVMVKERDHYEHKCPPSAGVSNEVYASMELTIKELRAEVEYLRSWAYPFSAQWVPAAGPPMAALHPFGPPMYGQYPGPMAMAACGYAPQSPVAPGGMAAPAGPFQPMYFGDLLQHPMAGPREQAGQHVDFARDNYYTTTEHALQQQAQEYEGAPEDDFLESQEVSAADYIQQPKQHSAEDQWRPAEIAVPANKRTLQPEEHCTAPKASFEQTEDEQVQHTELVEDKLIDADTALVGMDERGSGFPAAAKTGQDIAATFRAEAAEGTDIPAPMPEPLQPSAAEPTAAKPETYTGIFVPAHPVSAPCAVLVAAAAPTAMAGPSAQPAAMQESFVATSGATQGAGGGSAADHQLQRHPSLCTDPEGSSSSGGAESAPPASSEEEAAVSDQRGPSAEPAADVQLQLEGFPALGAIDKATAVPEPRATLPAPEPNTSVPTATGTAQEREMLPASSRDAVPAMSKSAGAVPATSMAKVAAAQHERKTWAVVAEELNHKPAACPLLRPRPEAAPQVGHAGGQAGGRQRPAAGSGPDECATAQEQPEAGAPTGGGGQKRALGQRAERRHSDNNKQGPRRGNGARGQPKTAQPEGKTQKGPSMGSILEVQRPSSHQTGQGASQARQSSRRKDANKPVRGGVAVLEVCRTPNGQWKPARQS
eukprot:jgi/Astpho2/6798/fgenesh1_pg.00103_%23_23_t